MASYLFFHLFWTSFFQMQRCAGRRKTKYTLPRAFRKAFRAGAVMVASERYRPSALVRFRFRL